jgi:hypothetical protein
MKRVMILTAILFVGVLQVTGQSKDGKSAAATPVAKCTGPDGKTACTAAHVKQLNEGMATGRRQHQPLETVKSVSLAKPDVTLACTQNDGTACTAEQLDALNDVAGQFKCALNYNSSKSNSGNIR